MYAIDINILLYASDSTSSFHGKADDFLYKCIKSREICVLPWPVIMGYLRIATHPRIFSVPLTYQEAIFNIEAILSQPHVRVVTESNDFWYLYKNLTKDIFPLGNSVPDAHLAALLQEHDVKTLYSADRDFRKYTFLKVINPLQ